MFAVAHRGLDEGWRRRPRLSLELLTQLRHLSAQGCVVGDDLLVLLLELGQLPAVILALRQLLPQSLVLLPQTLILVPEKIVTRKQASAIHGTCTLTPSLPWRAHQKATGR